MISTATSALVAVEEAVAVAEEAVVGAGYSDEYNLHLQQVEHAP